MDLGLWLLTSSDTEVKGCSRCGVTPGTRDERTRGHWSYNTDKRMGSERENGCVKSHSTPETQGGPGLRAPRASPTDLLGFSVSGPSWQPPQPLLAFSTTKHHWSFKRKSALSVPCLFFCSSEENQEPLLMVPTRLQMGSSLPKFTAGVPGSPRLHWPGGRGDARPVLVRGTWDRRKSQL